MADEEEALVSAEKGVEESVSLAPKAAQAVSRHVGAASRASGEEESAADLSRGEPSRVRGSDPSSVATAPASEARTVGRLSKTRHAPCRSTRFHCLLNSAQAMSRSRRLE